MLKILENSKVFLIVLLLGTLVLLTLATHDLGGELPKRVESKRRAKPPDAAVLVGKIEALLSPATFSALRPATNAVSPFYTTYFQPPPAPPAQPVTPAPPATAKKIPLTYQGMMEAGGGKRAFVKVGEGLFVGPVGAKVVADLVVSDIALRTLTLKNAASQTNILQFNVVKEIEVPAP
jgi:hypothetical protein